MKTLNEESRLNYTIPGGDGGKIGTPTSTRWFGRDGNGGWFAFDVAANDNAPALRATFDKFGAIGIVGVPDGCVDEIVRLLGKCNVLGQNLSIMYRPQYITLQELLRAPESAIGYWLQLPL
jgi:hypothetical protein